MPEYILGIDPAIRKLGIALIDADTYKPIGVKRYSNDTYGLPRMEYYCQCLKQICEQHKPVLIAKETPILSSGFGMKLYAILDLNEMSGLISWWLNELGYREDRGNYCQVPNLTWRHIIFAMTNINPKEVKKTDSAVRGSKDKNYLNYMQQATGYRFEDDDIADAYCIAKVGAIAHKLNTSTMMPWDFPPTILQSFIDNQYCMQIHTSAKVVANKIINGRNLQMFKNFSRFGKPSWGRRIPAEPGNKFGASIVITKESDATDLKYAHTRTVKKYKEQEKLL